MRVYLTTSIFTRLVIARAKPEAMTRRQILINITVVSKIITNFVK